MLNAALGSMAGELASGKIDGFAREAAKNMTADKAAQEVLANLIGSLAANAIGGAVSGESGASASANADKYNRQLHPEEWEWLKDKKNQKAFSEYVCNNAPDLCSDGSLSNIEAEATLLKQALRQVDFSWRYFLGNEQGPLDELASAFLLQSGKTIEATFGTNKAFVAANDAEYLDYRKYLAEQQAHLTDLNLFTQGFMKKDASVAQLQLLMLAASVYGAENIGMGYLPGGHNLDYAAIMKDLALKNGPVGTVPGQIEDARKMLAAIEYYKNNGCDGDMKCAMGKAQLEPIIDGINSKYKKFVETGKDDLLLLDNVYNGHYMSLGQLGEDLAQVAILLAAKKLAEKTGQTKAAKKAASNKPQSKISSAKQTQRDLEQGKLLKVNKPDPAADALAERIGGESRVRFHDHIREYDVINDKYIAQAKPGNIKMGSDLRDQMKATFEKAKETGHSVYFHCEGEPGPGVKRKLQEYSQRYGVELVIDTKPLKPKK